MFEGLAQPIHLVMILLIALLFFGPSKLAGLGKGMGEGIRGFKDALQQGASKSDQPDSAAKEQ
jgi:sec-independent protein translocase protein TatA